MDMKVRIRGVGHQVRTSLTAQVSKPHVDMKLEKPQLNGDNLVTSEPSESGVLTADTRILRADNGSEVTLDESARTGERPLVWSLDERKRMVARPITQVLSAGRRQVFMLRLASGRAVEATADSQFMTLCGWNRLRQLEVGQRLATPRRVPEPAHTVCMIDAEVVLLAHMIGDGSCVRNQPIRYASIDEQNLLAVSNAAKHFGVSAKRDDYPAARVITLRLPAPYHLTHGRRNPVAGWLDGLGLLGKRSYEKFVPASVFAAPNEQVALFLRHLWATDGCVAWDAKQGIGRIYYASTSRQLADDVRQLLLRLGISSRAHSARKAGYRDCWQLAVSGVNNQRQFIHNVDVHGEKFFAVREVLANLAGIQSNDNVDTVPRQVWDQVRQGLADQQVTHRAFAVAMQTKFCGSTMWKHSPSRGRLHRAAAVLDDQALHDLTTNDVFWDKMSRSRASVSAMCTVSPSSTHTTWWHRVFRFVRRSKKSDSLMAPSSPQASQDAAPAHRSDGYGRAASAQITTAAVGNAPYQGDDVSYVPIVTRTKDIFRAPTIRSHPDPCRRSHDRNCL